MNTIKMQNPVVITQEDYNLIRPFADEMGTKDGYMSLAYELDRAIILQQDAFPAHAIRINSKASVLDLETQRVMELTLVLPAHADTNENKISITTPMGIALIGYRKAEEVYFEVPSGLKRFRILDVVNA